jgi:flagellin
MRVNHNKFSLGIYKNYKSTLEENSKTINNISTGKKLNSAKDNPNKIAQSENLKINLLSRDAAISNIQDTNSMLQTFDGALQEMNNDASRLKELTVSAANGTKTDEDKAVIQKEINRIKENMDYVARNTSFNGIVMSGTTGTSKKSTIGALSDENIDIPFFDLTNVGTGVDGIDVTDPTKVDSNVEAADKAGSIISLIRSKYGAIQSRLEDTFDDMSGMNISLTSAQSSLEDADIANEVLENSRTNIIYQSALALMAQSNKLPQDALNVLASVR